MNRRRIDATSMAESPATVDAPAIQRAGKPKRSILRELIACYAAAALRSVDVSGRARRSQYFQRDRHAVSAREKESHLTCFVALVPRCVPEAALPQGRCFRELIDFGERGERVLRRSGRDPLLSQLVCDGASAVAAGFLRDNALRKARVRQITALFEFVER